MLFYVTIYCIKNGVTPLLQAVRLRNMELITLLICGGAHLNTPFVDVSRILVDDIFVRCQWLCLFGMIYIIAVGRLNTTISSDQLKKYGARQIIYEWRSRYKHPFSSCALKYLLISYGLLFRLGRPDATFSSSTSEKYGAHNVINT